MQVSISLIVQMRLSERWGSDDDIREREEIAEAIGSALEKRGCGHFDGTDVGGGATNLFFCEIPDDHWEEALAIAVSEVERRGVSDKVVIAKSVFIDQEPEPDVNDTVVSPPNFRGEFDVFGWSGDK